MFEEKGYETG